MFTRIEFERVTPREVGVDARALERLLDELEYGGFTEPHSLMLMKDGQIFAEGWWNPYTPYTVHGLQSHTKTYAATAIGIAYTQGLLDLNERIIDIFPEDAPDNPSENLTQLKIRDVLCMGCGMEKMPSASKKWISDFLHIPVVHKPGTAFMYNSMGSTLLAAILYRKTGIGLEPFLKEHLFDLIGIDSSSHKWMYMPDRTEVGGGGLLATTEDNLRLMKLYANNGRWNDKQILSEDYVQLATTMQNDTAQVYQQGEPLNDHALGYGFQMWMCKPHGAYRADGAYGQFTIVVPEMNMILAITETAVGPENPQKTLDAFWRFLEDVRTGEPRSMEEDMHLVNRMRSLSLPRVYGSAYSPTVEAIHRKAFYLNDSGFLMHEDGMEYVITGSEKPSYIKAFSFSFEHLRCSMSCTTDTETYTLDIPMDGSEGLNLFQNTIFEKALMRAYWEDNQLHILTRWIEGCTSQERIFTFHEDTVKIETITNGITNEAGIIYTAAVK